LPAFEQPTASIQVIAAIAAPTDEDRMSPPRIVEPEWLDQLPADDPRAIRHRRDLRRINVIIQQSRIMANVLSAHWSQSDPSTLLDLGSGDGTFMLRVARQLTPRRQGVTVTLLDQQNIVSRSTREAFAALGWEAQPVRADVFDYLAGMHGSKLGAITANLFLHHFSSEQLAQLLAFAAQSTRLFVACEPRRSKFALQSSKFLWMIGCSEVAREDAIISVRAGFRGKELSESWPKQDHWKLQEDAAKLFTHRFVAMDKK